MSAVGAVPASAPVETPAVVVDRDILERNIARMAASVRERGWTLRPHVKTHKTPEIAALQLAAGAVGITVATIGEAEVFVEHGARDVFVAYPLRLSPGKAARLAALRDVARVAVGVDSAEGAVHLGVLAPGLDVLVEVDSGHHRSGVAVEAALTVARAAAAAGLEVVGVFTFPGHSYGPGAAAPAARAERETLAAAAEALRRAGFDIRVVSGGSTPSMADTEAGGVTEVRPGVYVFGDAQQWELGHCDPSDIALTVHATVVSAHADCVILDAGSKVLGADRAAWATGFGRLLDRPDARITALSEHHATVTGDGLPALGEVVRVAPNHVCSTVNLADELVVTRGGAEVARWRVAARGRNA